MKWSILIVGLICFGLGVTFSLLILGKIDLILLKGISISTVFGIAIEGVKWFRQYLKDKSKERKEYVVRLAKSFRKLADELKMGRPISEKEYGHILYLNRVIGHLTSGYEEDWALWKECQLLTTQYYEEKSNILRELEERLSALPDCLKNILPMYATLERIARDIFYKIQFDRTSYQIKPAEGNYYMIEFKDMAVRSLDIPKLKKLAQILNQLVFDQGLNERISSNKTRWNQASEKFEQFKIRLKRIAEDAELTGKLKGKWPF